MSDDQTTAASGGDEGLISEEDVRALATEWVQRGDGSTAAWMASRALILLNALDAARAERDQARDEAAKLRSDVDFLEQQIAAVGEDYFQARTEARQWRERAERAEAAMPADESDDGWTATAAERESFERIAAVLAATPAATGDDKGHGVYTCDVAYCDTHGTVR